MRIFEMRAVASRALFAFGFVSTVIFAVSLVDWRTSASPDRRVIAMQMVADGLASPRLIAYHAATNNLVVASGESGSVSLLTGKGTAEIVAGNTLGDNGLQDPRTIAAINSHEAAFDYGDIFIGYSGGRIARIHAETADVEIIQLPGETAAVVAVSADENGEYGGGLLALTENGTLWNLAAARGPRVLAEMGSSASSMTFVADEAIFGPLAGKLVVATTKEKKLVAVGPSGEITPVSVQAEFGGLTFIKPNGSIFTAWSKKGAIYAGKVASEKGILAATTDEKDKVYSLSFDNGSLKASIYGLSEPFDEITAAPLAIKSRPDVCVTSVVPNLTSFQWRGGEGTFAVNAPAGCAWTASSSALWLQITSGATGTGNGNVSYYAGKNVTAALRQSGITVDGQTHSVNQSKKAQFGCNVTLSNAAPNVAAIGGAGTINVSQGPDCAWTAVSTDPWLTLTKASGSGNGSFSYAATTNFGAQARQASVIFPNISGQYALVTQAPNQAPTVNAGPTQTITLPSLAALAGAVTDDGVGNPVTTSWSKISGPESVIFSNASNLNTNAIFSKEGTYVLRLTASDGYLTSFANVTVNVNADQTPPPPDPVTVAPPLNMTVATNIADSTRFLYSGSNPIQTGVAAGTIKDERVAVLRGRVLNKAGQPITNVTISILDHPELGQTRSRADGKFDLAVNGGGELAVKYEKVGFISVQREEKPDWRVYEASDDVVMMPYDGNVTTIDLSASVPVQVASGSLSSDSSGQRQARLLFRQGTTATAVLPNGSTQALNRLNVRATEFTVGDTGRAAMPGELPPTSEYTYASEFSADEAVALGATRVNFSQPVIQYLENFIGFPTGASVPTGSYNRVTAMWEVEQSGQIVKVLSITSGTANLDVTGGGQPATDQEYATLGINLAERQTLAQLYAVNQTLWRVPLSHFTPWDCNYPPANKPPPDAPPPFAPKPKKICKGKDGCIEEIQTQTLTEKVPVTIISYQIKYQITYRTNLQKEAVGNSAVIPLVGPSPDPDLESAAAQIDIGGRVIRTDITPAVPNLTYNFQWDGMDAFGRRLQGPQTAHISVTHFYPLGYTTTKEFGQTGTGTGTVFVRTGTGITLRNYEVQLGGFDQGPTGLGGWAFDINHSYDPSTRTLVEGDGNIRTATAIVKTVRTTAGVGEEGFDGDGGPAFRARLAAPSDVAFAPDGSYYIADTRNDRIRRVSADGVISTVAGNGTQCDPLTPCGDGGPATAARLSGPHGLAVAPNGDLLISDTGSNRIRKVSGGTITTIAGTGAFCQPLDACGDGGAAALSRLNSPRHIHLAADGALYIADNGSNRIRKIGTNGVIRTIAGNGMENCPSDNVPALNACLESPTGVALADNGSLFITANAPSHSQVVRLDTDGVVHKIADGICNGARPDGLRSICNPMGVTVGPDGSPYVASAGEHRIYRYGVDNVWEELIGSGSNIPDSEGQPVQAANLNAPAASAFAPNGDLYIAVEGDHRVRRAASPLPGYSNSPMVIASEDGTEAFEFDANGRHLRTFNALTGTPKYVFGYDSAGRLITITDGDNNVTTVERDSAGKPTGIRSPFGQLTTVTLDANGYLASITDPAGETNRYTYSAGGLMLTKRDAKNNLNTFTYDAEGHLIRNEDPAGGQDNFSRSGTASDFTVTTRSPLTRTSAFQVLTRPTGEETQNVLLEDGSRYRVTTLVDGSTAETSPDGTMTPTTLGPDPRWGMQAPIAVTDETQAPSGLDLRLSQSRSVTLADPANPFSITQQHDTQDQNGRSYTLDYTAASRSYAAASPLGRQATIGIDTQERPTRYQIANLNPTNLGYDSRGRLTTETSGTGSDARTTTSSYNASGYLSSEIDPLNHTNAFLYDLAGRTTQKTLSDGRTIGFGYDANGNLTSVTPPGRSPHSFVFNSRDLLQSYTAPNVGGSSTTTYDYNADDDLTRITRPDGLQINYGFNAGGQVTSRTTPTGSYAFTYNSTTGLITGIAAPGGISNSFGYDGSLLTNSTLAGEVAGSVGLAYDNDRNVTSVAVNGSGAVNYTYDNDGLVVGTGALTLNRNAESGLLAGSTLGNVTDTFTYNGFGESDSYNAKFNNNTIYNVNYTYDKLGRIVRKQESIGGTTTTYDYGFDSTDRLSTVTLNGAPQPLVTYGYDTNDNRTSSNTGGSVTNASYDNQDRLTAYGSTNYTYTANGELLTKTGTGGTTTYAYDVLGNLRTVALPGGTQIQYLIDGLDRRIGKKVNGTLTQGFLYQDDSQIAAELNAAGNVVSRFVYATQLNVPDYILKNGQTYRLICDQVGSVRLVIDASSGTIVQRLDYDEFGVVLNDTNPGFQPFGFAGGLYDPQTRLVRFGARDYDAEVGRWTAKDPIRFDGNDTNLYAYVFSDPINLTDTSGLGGRYSKEEIKKRDEKCLKKLFDTVKNVFTGGRAPTNPAELILETGNVLKETGDLIGEAGDRYDQLAKDQKKFQKSPEVQKVIKLNKEADILKIRQRKIQQAFFNRQKNRIRVVRKRKIACCTTGGGTA